MGLAALCPGTFDPVTNGHLDIIERAASVFDPLVVAVLENPGKEPVFGVEDRLGMLKEALADLPAVEVAAFSGLLVDVAKERGGVDDPVLRQRLAKVYTDGEIYRIHNLLTVAARVKGLDPGPVSAIRKALGDPHGRDVFRLARDLAGTAGLLEQAGPLGAEPGWWAQGFLFSPALTIGGGTSEVLRNVIGERILGLPREPDPDAGRPWSDTRGAAAAGRAGR